MEKPEINMYFNEEMPILVTTCCKCNVELFRSMTYTTKTLHKNHCLTCISEIEDKAWKYEELCK